MADEPRGEPPLSGAEAGKAAARKKTKLPPPKRKPSPPPEDERPQTHRIITDGTDG